MGYEVDFLAVGDGEKSGDAIALRFGNLHGSRNEQFVAVIDGGTQESGKRLVEHIRAYYDTDYVDLVVSTHPDADHVSGLKVVVEEMDVERIWMHQPWNHTEDIARLFKDGRVTDSSVREKLRKSLEAARSLEELALSKEIDIIEPFTGLSTEGEFLTVLGPTQEFYEEQLPNFRGTPQPRLDTFSMRNFSFMSDIVNLIEERWDIETLNDDGKTSAENNTSTILLLQFDGQRLLFTGDAGIPALTEVADILEEVDFDFSTLEFFQIPHHGSRRNVGPSVLNRLIGPKQRAFQSTLSAFVSASKNGAPKHPAKKVTNAFRRRGAEVYATQGRNICHSHEAPDREGWTQISSLPFYSEVEE